MDAGQRVLVIEGDYAGELATVAPNEEGRHEDFDSEEVVWLHFDRDGQTKGEYAILEDQWVPVSELKAI